MNWHIYNINHEPLCWDDKALEFNTKEEAEEFIAICKKLDLGIFDDNEIQFSIKHDILYYDGGYIKGDLFLLITNLGNAL